MEIICNKIIFTKITMVNILYNKIYKIRIIRRERYLRQEMINNFMDETKGMMKADRENHYNMNYTNNGIKNSIFYRYY